MRMDNNKTEEILNSLVVLQMASAPDFFYTLLRAKMEKGIVSPAQQPVWYLRPAFVLATLFAIVAVNAMVFLKNNTIQKNTAAVDYTDVIQQTVASDFSQADNNLVYDLTMSR